MKTVKIVLGLALVVMLIAACAPKPTEAPPWSNRLSPLKHP